MKRTITILLLFTTGLSSLFSQMEESGLQRAYKLENDSLLQNFFTIWSSDTLSLNENQEIQSEINLVFCMFFDPENISKVSGLSNWDSIYSHSKYYILQNQIKAHIVKSDSLQRSGVYVDSLLENFEINNFRPKLQLKNHEILYLSNKYEGELYQFLGKPGKNVNRNNSKLKFLSSYVKIIPATDNSWFFETRPVVSDVYFNRTKKIARLDFSLFFQNGSAYFVKENEQWKMIWSGITDY